MFLSLTTTICDVFPEVFLYRETHMLHKHKLHKLHKHKRYNNLPRCKWLQHNEYKIKLHNMYNKKHNSNKYHHKRLKKKFIDKFNKQPVHDCNNYNKVGEKLTFCIRF